MLVVIRGAGDIASGIAVRLFNCGISVVMTEIPKPTAVRTTVAFSTAILNGSTKLENIDAVHAKTIESALSIISEHQIPVIVDPAGECIGKLHPDAVIDAILAKRNTGTNISDAGIVIGVGPGFNAGVDCHAVIETQRGHNLGRAIYSGCAAEDTGIPGNIGGYTVERIIKASKDGTFMPTKKIGDFVKAGEIVAYVDDFPVVARIDGIIRGMLPGSTNVISGMKSGDIDPRCNPENCKTVSDKARAVAGGVLEALLHLSIK